MVLNIALFIVEIHGEQVRGHIECIHKYFIFYERINFIMKEYWYEIKKYRFSKIEILFVIITILLPIPLREDIVLTVIFVIYILSKVFYLKSKKKKKKKEIGTFLKD